MFFNFKHMNKHNDAMRATFILRHVLMHFVELEHLS